MTISEAIEELERGIRQNRSTNNRRLRRALGLGIEALQWIKEKREKTLGLVPFSLPSEDKNDKP